MTSLQQAERKIKDLKIQNENLKTQLKHQREYYEEKIEKMEKNFNRKFDAIMSVMSNLENKVDKLTKENVELKDKVKILQEENNELRKENDELRKENDILKGKAIQKNSSNSNIPPSKDEYKIQNHREKSSRKQGGQEGRKGKTLTSKEIEELIKNNGVEVIEEHYGNKKSSKTIIKYIMDVKTKVIIRKIYIRGNMEEINDIEIPEECKMKSTVVYGKNLKTLVGIMYAQEVIAFDRMAEFISILTDNVLNVSHGSLVNWVNEISKKCKKIKRKLKRAIKHSKIVCTDLTVTSLNGKSAYDRNYSNNVITIFEASHSKRIGEIQRQNILPNFKGYIMHDHETGIYNFGIKSQHLECWIHLGRELKYFDEYIKNSWSSELWNFAWNINKKRKENMKNNIKSFTPEEIIEYENKYDEIVQKGILQNGKTESKYLRDKEKAVLNRLTKYKINYLNFIKDFELPFDDNLSERDLRPVKIKKKVSGCHRSFEGLKDYCNIRTIISTCIKQGISYFEVLKNVVANKTIPITKAGLIMMP